MKLHYVSWLSLKEIIVIIIFILCSNIYPSILCSLGDARSNDTLARDWIWLPPEWYVHIIRAVIIVTIL